MDICIFSRILNSKTRTQLPKSLRLWLYCVPKKFVTVRKAWTFLRHFLHKIVTCVSPLVTTLLSQKVSILACPLKLLFSALLLLSSAVHLFGECLPNRMLFAGRWLKRFLVKYVCKLQSSHKGEI